MTEKEKLDLIKEILPELTKELIPALKNAVMEDIAKEYETGRKRQQDAQKGKSESIDYAALIKDALK